MPFQLLPNNTDDIIDGESTFIFQNLFVNIEYDLLVRHFYDDRPNAMIKL